jgi:uncharacterized protein
MTLKISLDIDGVLRNIVTPSIKSYELAGGKKKFKYADIINYDFRKELDIEDFEKFFRTNAETIFLNSRAMPYTSEVYRLKDYGKIQIITSQYKGLEKLTLDWLERHNIHYDEIHFTWNKEDVKTDILLDDYPNNLNKMPDETIKVCYDCPYNRNTWDGLRVKNMKEFINLVSDISKDL